jgi:hypothetical protein
MPKNTPSRFALISLATYIAASLISQAQAQTPDMKMTTPIPPEVTTPERVETPIGTFQFLDGAPTTETTKLIYDNLDRMRGVETYLSLLPVVSLYGLRDGHEKMAGRGSNKVTLFSQLLDSKSLFLTANTSTLYAFAFTDLEKEGPTVVELPPGMLGALNDATFQWVGDYGPAGPDKGKGGKYLILPPGHKGKAPDGYFVQKPPTFRNWMFLRGSTKDGIKAGVENITAKLRIYPLDKADAPPKMDFVDVSGKAYNTLPPNDFSFYQQLDAVIQEEPIGSLDPERRGLAAAIGIVKGQAFNPDPRMRQLLDEAVAIGNATARTIVWRPRVAGARIYGKDSQWVMAYADKDVFFLKDGARNLDARTMFHYPYTGISPAMAVSKPGIGSDYGIAFLDSQQQAMDGAKTYKLTLPKDVPVKDFWAVTVYDSQTRSQIQTDQQFPTLGSKAKGLQKNPDGSYDIFFGPKAPPGKESNWLQTIPGDGWFAALRMYGPLEAWIKQTWRPGEIELVK